MLFLKSSLKAEGKGRKYYFDAAKVQRLQELVLDNKHSKDGKNPYDVIWTNLWNPKIASLMANTSPDYKQINCTFFFPMPSNSTLFALKKKQDLFTQCLLLCEGLLKDGKVKGEICINVQENRSNNRRYFWGTDGFPH